MEYLLLKLIFWLSYLVFPFLGVCLFFLFSKKNLKRGLWAGVLILSLLFLEARFFEPNMLDVHREFLDIFEDEREGEVRIAVVGDLHLGVFHDEDFLKKIVKMVNDEEPDLVFLVGDFVYYAKEEDLEKLFEPLGDLEGQVFAVLGNHDFGVDTNEGDLSKEITKTFAEQGVKMMDNKVERVRANGEEYAIVGIGSLLAKQARMDILDEVWEEEQVIVLTHNPDVVDYFPQGKVDLAVAAHTHCGQVRLPFLYKKAIPTEGDFDKGLYQEENTALYISCGVGEVQLPMRFLNLPVVDVLEIN